MAEHNGASGLSETDLFVIMAKPIAEVAAAQDRQLRSEGYIRMSEAHELSRISYRHLAYLTDVQVVAGVKHRFIHVEGLIRRIARDSADRANEFGLAVERSGVRQRPLRPTPTPKAKSARLVKQDAPVAAQAPPTGVSEPEAGASPPQAPPEPEDADGEITYPVSFSLRDRFFPQT